MKKGLVMEGGAMRGIFTCGIIDVFMENDISFDGAAGVSAGACFGCNIKSRQIGRGLRYNKKYCNDKQYASWSSLLRTGDLYNVVFCYNRLPKELDVFDTGAFTDNPMEFYSVSTDINTGKAAYHKCYDGKDEDLQWIRASASIPLFARPVAIDGGLYLDGGISDSIPLAFMESMGYDRNIVIETQPVNYRKKPQSYMPLIKFCLRKYPNMIKAMQDRYLMYNEQKEYVRHREEAGEILVLRPAEPLNIKSPAKSPDELDRVYNLGRELALARLNDIRAFLS